MTTGSSESEQPRSWGVRWPLLKQFVAFFLGSGVGLIIDLAGFQLLILLGLQPWLANGVSSFVSITAVYLLVSRYSFGADANAKTYVAFVVWYSSSIIVFSLLIQLVSDASGWAPFAVKLLSVPVSFALNYVFSRFLFRSRRISESSAPTESE